MEKASQKSGRKSMIIFMRLRGQKIKKKIDRIQKSFRGHKCCHSTVVFLLGKVIRMIRRGESTQEKYEDR
jgi:hypothetical protein